MSKHLLVLSGPVSSASFKNVKWSTVTDIIAINHGIGPSDSNCEVASDPNYNKPPCIGSGAFANLGDQYPLIGRLKAIVNDFGFNINDYSRICLAGFSAGHGLNELILKDSESRNLITCFYAMDSYYTGPNPGVKSGYLSFAQQAANDYSKAMIMTTSGFAGQNYISGTDSIRPLLEKLGIDSKQLIVGRPYRKGNFVYINEGTSVAHGEHATVLGPIFFQQIISPWMTQLDGNKPLEEQDMLYIPGKSTNRWVALGLFAFGIASISTIGYLIYKDVDSSKS